jgi:hypothetical protein
MSVEANEVIEAMYQFALEARVRAGMVQSDFRRGSTVKLRRARQNAALVARHAADLASAAFQVVDALDEECQRRRITD